MKVEIFTFCEYAANYAGKLVIIGASDLITNWQNKCVIENRFLVHKLRLEKGDKNKFRAGLSFEDETGAVLKSFSCKHNLQKFGPSGFEPAIGIVFLDYLELPKPCVYYAWLSVDNERLASLPIYVLQSEGHD
ncbi:MAG TPA: hypothetical protein VH280_11585 [Verrucomicrobiae bacterium]|jgi:hypothetical protein|nr:hypothetical protein [Verrucomicrobiae bacterium]